MSAFRNDSLLSLPFERKYTIQIDVLPDIQPHYCPIFQLLPAKFLPTKEYMEDALGKEKILPSKSHFEALLFFFNQQGKLCRVVYNRAFEKIV